jgi:hypothetical protein
MSRLKIKKAYSFSKFLRAPFPPPVFRGDRGSPAGAAASSAAMPGRREARWVAVAGGGSRRGVRVRPGRRGLARFRVSVAEKLEGVWISKIAGRGAS